MLTAIGDPVEDANALQSMKQFTIGVAADLDSTPSGARNSNSSYHGYVTREHTAYLKLP